ncbi:MAG: hypothetical protein FWF20_03330 [Betaproteobacteria bacterium]|nr:hypothetical protein [Betaproteobacteria bacterium]MCL2885814.1 hypothetical protein [Betaproteobacteria bacterium]
MSAIPEPPLSPASEAVIQSVLDWLIAARDRSDSDNIEQVHYQLLKLHDTPLPAFHRSRLLGMLHEHVEHSVKAELPAFQKISLPVARRLRQRIRRVNELLETLTQDYFNALTELFDLQAGTARYPLDDSLRRALQGIAWRIRIDHLVAAPNGIGLWQQLHDGFRTACRIGLETFPKPYGASTIQRIYSDTLLVAIAQPASFSASELEFIHDYIEASPFCIEPSEAPPDGAEAVFWIDPEQDFPAHALIRRLPANDAQPLYFACDAIAGEIVRQLDELGSGGSAAALKLPVFAETRNGRGVLRRLAKLWGKPVRRRFSRRRQSSRAHLFFGLDNLWRLMRQIGDQAPVSEWMITNESPDGYALMHVSDDTSALCVGGVVAMRMIDAQDDSEQPWSIGIIRWVISENPEHLELGLQVIARHAVAVELARPYELEAGSVAALLLPEAPPLQAFESLLVASGTIRNDDATMLLLVERDNLVVREIRTGEPTEQTSSIELISVSPQDSA